MLRSAGYATGVVGKWHLGLGPKGGPDWNGDITPGPNDIGFDYSFIMAATGDRVPTVYVENRRVVGLDPADPITVSYSAPVDDGRDRQEQSRAAEDGAEPRPRSDDRQRHQPHRLHEGRQGGAVERRGHGRRLHPPRRPLHRAAEGAAVLPVLRAPRPARAARAASALRRQDDDGTARRCDRRDGLVGRRDSRHARSAEADRQHPGHLHQRQRAGRGRRLQGRCGGEARKPYAVRTVPRREVQPLRRRNARAVHRALAGPRQAGHVGRADLAGRFPARRSPPS